MPSEVGDILKPYVAGELQVAHSNRMLRSAGYLGV
jgi:hypothetical protein